MMDRIKKTIFFTVIVASCCTFSKHFILLARPGSGKGTFSNYMSKKYGYIHLGLGDLYRERHDNHLPVTSKILTKILEKRVLLAAKNNQKIILDNVISCWDDWKHWKAFFKKHNLIDQIVFISLEATDITCMNRMKERVICRKCFNVYKQSSDKTLQEHTCLECGNKLSIRSRDRVDHFVQKRFAYYHQKTEPLIFDLKESGMYKVIKISTETELDKLYTLYDKLSKL